MQQRIAYINHKKERGNNKSQLFNNQMFGKFITKNKNKNKILMDIIKTANTNSSDNYNSLQQNLINLSTNKISINNQICDYALKINGIINDLHDVVENSSPVINTPEHPFTKLNIERHLMIGTSIKPYVFESEPTITINESGKAIGIWSDRIDIGGFIDNNINTIYELVINNGTECTKNSDGTIKVNLYELKYEHINGDVTFVRSMVVDPVNNMIHIIKTWNITLTC